MTLRQARKIIKIIFTIPPCRWPRKTKYRTIRYKESTILRAAGRAWREPLQPPWDKL